MAIEFKLPELGENVASGDVTRILVKVGDAVKKDQPVLEMETGKATVEIPCSASGVVQAIHVREGQKAQVGQLVLTLDGTAEAPAPAAPKAPPAKPAAAPAPVAAPAPAAPVIRPPSAPPVAPKAGIGNAAPAAPSTRQFAREIGLDVTAVAGTGPGGRISIEDVKAHARAVMASGGTARAAAAATPPLPDFGKWGAIERQPLSNVRQATAQAMALAWSNVPRVTLQDKADLTDIEKLRQEYKAKAEKAGAKLTLTAFLIRIAASALKQFPQFNASLDLAANEMVLKKYVNIGVAMDTEKGLVVPVIRGVDGMTALQVAGELTKLTERAKAKKIGLEDMQGGCFSITNLGSIGVGHFTPIVNFPEVAILGVGRAVMEPVMVNGFFQPRLMLPLSLAFDHRVIDGADGARFLRWIIDAIQQPALLAVEG